MAQTKAKARPEAAAAPAVRLSTPSVTCTVAKGTKIEGNFHSSENIRLDGAVHGELRCDKKLVMGEGSRLEGKIFAADAVIMGEVVGDISVQGALQLTHTAQVTGSIVTRHLIVDEGARYEGQCKAGA